MPPLGRAIALPQVDGVAVQIGQDLDFDVPRALDVFLQVNGRVAEGRFGFVLCLNEPGLERQVVRGHPHPLAAAACGCFDQDGETDLVRDLQRFFFVFQQPRTARHDGDLGFAGQPPRLVLVAQLIHGFGRRPDEIDIAASADFVELGVLCQKPVPGMDRLDVAHLGGADHAVDPQVAVGALGRADAIGFVGHLEIGCLAVRFAVDNDGFDAHLAAGANDTESDFAAVGDQNAFIHVSSETAVTCLYRS